MIPSDLEVNQWLCYYTDKIVGKIITGFKYEFPSLDFG